MKTLIISSSLSPSSHSYVLCRELEKFLKQQKKNVDITFIDLRDLEIVPAHQPETQDMKDLAAAVDQADNYIFGVAIHNYSINDSMRMILDTSLYGAKGKFYGILCAAWGANSYLATMHLTQTCMTHHRMIQLPRVVYAIWWDFDEHQRIINPDITERCEQFTEDFVDLGRKLL